MQTMIIKIIKAIVSIPIYIIGYGSYGGPAIMTILSVLLGLMIPFIILLDKEKLPTEEKIIEDPITAAINIFKTILIFAILVAIIDILYIVIEAIIH